MAATKGAGGGKVRNKRPQTKTAMAKPMKAMPKVPAIKAARGTINPQTGRVAAKGAVASQQGAKVRADQLARLRRSSAPAKQQPDLLGQIGNAIGGFFGSRNAEMTGQKESTISRAMKAGPAARDAIRRAGGN